jgi:hypothetical protein
MNRGSPECLCVNFLIESTARCLQKRQGYPKFAEPFRDRIRESAEQMAKVAGIEIEFIRTRSIRKEDRAPKNR